MMLSLLEIFVVSLDNNFPCSRMSFFPIVTEVTNVKSKPTMIFLYATMEVYFVYHHRHSLFCFTRLSCCAGFSFLKTWILQQMLCLLVVMTLMNQLLRDFAIAINLLEKDYLVPTFLHFADKAFRIRFKKERKKRKSWIGSPHESYIYICI